MIKRKYSLFSGTNPIDHQNYWYIRDHTGSGWTWVTREDSHLHCLLFKAEADALQWIDEHGELFEK